MQFYDDQYQKYKHSIIILKNDSELNIEGNSLNALKHEIFLLSNQPQIKLKTQDVDFVPIKNVRLFQQNLYHYPILHDFFKNNQTSKEYLYFHTANQQEIGQIIHLIINNTQDFFMTQLSLILLAKLGENHREWLSKIQSTMMKDNLAGAMIKYIELNCKTVNLELIAKAFNYHPAYFSKLFYQLMKTPFKEMVKEIRLEKAQKLICDTSFSIKKIAEEVGYCDVNHFYKIFKEKYHISPKQSKRHASNL